MINEFDSLDDAQRSRIEDAIFTASKFGLNFIPVAGPFLSELMGFMFANPIEARRTTFFNDLSSKLDDLVQNGSVNYDNLKNDASFMNVIMNSVPMALRSFEDEKRIAFRNAILNTALGVNPDETETQVFLNHLSRITYLHVKILVYCQDPKRWFNLNNIEQPEGFSTTILASLKKGFLDLSSKDELIEIIWSDLFFAKLIVIESPRVNLSYEGSLSPMTSKMGNNFLKFITFTDSPL